MTLAGSRKFFLGAVGLLLAVTAWALAATGPMQDTPLPHPLQVLGESLILLQNREFWLAFGVTLSMATKGFLLALLVGVVLGVLVGWFSLLGKACTFVIEFLKPIPPIVIMPLAILVLGPTQQMGEFLVFYGCLLPILYQTAAGVKETDPVTIQTSKSYGVGVAEILGRVVLPSASAFIATAIRTAIPISLIVSIVAGLLGGGPGLGYSIQRALGSNSMPELYALVILLGLLGLGFQIVSQQFEGRFLKWHPSYRKVVN